MRIVIVSRDAARAESLAREITKLARCAADVRVASTRQGALLWARGPTGGPMVVVADLHLEVANGGVELLCSIRRRMAEARCFLVAPQGRFPGGVEGLRLIAEGEPLERVASLVHAAGAVPLTNHAHARTRT